MRKNSAERMWQRRIPLAVFGAALWVLSSAAPAQVLIIANPGLRATEVSRQDLREVLTGASSTLKGAGQVTPVLLKEGAVHDEMLSLYVGKSDSAFRANYRSLLFSGAGIIPKTFDSEAAMVAYVAHTPGTIGYIGSGTAHEGVKVLVVR